MDEEILGIFPGWLRDKSNKWIVKGWTFNLIFTSERLFIADMKKRTGNPTFLGEPVYVSTYASIQEQQKMKEIVVEEMLKDNAGNPEIPYSEIGRVEIKSPFGVSHRDLVIFSCEDVDNAKYTFSIMIRDRYRGVFEEFIQSVLPDKV